MTGIAAFQVWLKQNMDERGWTYADLAREAGMSKQAVSYYMSNRTKYPTIEGIAAICGAFKLPVETALVILGILPRHDRDALDVEVEHLVEQLDKEDKEEAVRFLRYRLQLKKGQDHDRRRPKK